MVAMAFDVNSELVDMNNNSSKENLENSEPFVGMEFESEEAAKEGFHHKKQNDTGKRKRKRAIIREGCNAMIESSDDLNLVQVHSLTPSLYPFAAQVATKISN
ncbi:hypothetical protein E2562_001495 [Oryza meyeriana var. granulata]|uniref:Uncharacterized protein n=1 Tax=Oryza meyeriana var. granulata TaxID=110450 RepID=A0A6G1DC02_9ORYZ|nr:hypothetical protein E2562_001495 [Oryza meyeriana var. granulata]